MSEFSREAFDEPLLERIKLPDGWKIEPLKYHVKMTKGLSIQKTDLVEEGIPVISYGQIHSKKNTTVELKEEFLRYVPRKFAPVYSTSKLKQGDVVFADTSEDVEGIGNAIYNNHAYEVYAGYHTVTCSPKGQTLNGSYFTYLTRTDYWRSQLRKLAMGVKVFSITQSILSRAFVLLPPIEVQGEIAKKLDVLISQIDVEEDLLEKQIDVLERYKKSVIHEAVTKGIHPNVPMKSSGIEWIGDIPEHWNLMRVKDLFKISAGNGFSIELQGRINEQYPFFKCSDLASMENQISEVNNSVSQADVTKEGYNLIEPGSILMAKIGEAMKKNRRVLSRATCCIDNNMQALTPEQSLYISRYALLVLMQINSEDYDNGGPIPSINNIKLKSALLPLPPLSEQQEIADYLDEKCAKIDAILDIKRKQVEILKKRRQSLIYEYVTGKCRVETGV